MGVLNNDGENDMYTIFVVRANAEGRAVSQAGVIAPLRVKTPQSCKSDRSRFPQDLHYTCEGRGRFEGICFQPFAAIPC